MRKLSGGARHKFRIFRNTLSSKQQPLVHDPTSLEDYRTIIPSLEASSLISIIKTDLNGNYTFVNDSFLREFGYKREDLIGTQSMLTIVKEDWPLCIEVVGKCAKNIGVPQHVVLRKPTADNVIRVNEWEFTMVADKNGIPAEVICVGFSVAEKIIAKQDVHKKSAIIQTILKTAPIGIWMQDKDGKFLFVNDSFCNAVGVTETQFLESDHYSKLLEADSSKQCMTSDKVAYGKEGPSVSYEKIRCADGKLHDLKVIKTKMVDEHLNLTGLVGISVDISELKQLEFQLKKAMETAESASRLKDAFLDNLSHELRTPLHGILGMTTIIQEVFEESPNPKFDYAMTSLEDSIFRLLRTVDMILGFTQLQIGDFNINPRKMDINQLLVNIVKQYREKAKQKGILFEFTPGDRAHIVKADENSILTVFAHLIDNAVKFTRKGKVSITIEDTELSTIVYIEDTGIGMSLDFQQHLYEPYSQQSIGRSRDFEGLGLGLSIVKKLLDLNNIDITIESKESVGTTCLLTFLNDLDN